jgi:hypothetical protein
MTLAMILLAVLFLGFLAWTVRRDSTPSRGQDDSSDVTTFMPHKPLTPDFNIPGWDGWSGLQMALAVELSEGQCFPVIEAGTSPPVSATKTLTTADAEQQTIRVNLYGGLSGDTSKNNYFGRLLVGPLPITGEQFRSVDVTFTIESDGTARFDASAEGDTIQCEIEDQHLGALPIGT